MLLYFNKNQVQLPRDKPFKYTFIQSDLFLLLRFFTIAWGKNLPPALQNCPIVNRKFILELSH